MERSQFPAGFYSCSILFALYPRRTVLGSSVSCLLSCIINNVSKSSCFGRNTHWISIYVCCCQLQFYLTFLFRYPAILPNKIISLHYFSVFPFSFLHDVITVFNHLTIIVFLFKLSDHVYLLLCPTNYDITNSWS